MSEERVNIIGVNISAVNMDSAVRQVTEHIDDARHNYICVSNVHTTVFARENEYYKDIQNNSYLSLPDGKPLSVVGKKKGYREMDRVTGPDFMEQVMLCPGFRHYFYGNTEENLNTLIDYLKRQYPDTIIAGYQPSVFRDLTPEEREQLIKDINDSGADFIWVGLGAPKQEIFCKEMAPYINGVLIGVGGAFNVVCGIIPRAPEWMQKASLEWFYRFLREPRRLFKRYFVTNSKFIYYMLHDSLKRK